MKKNDVYLLLCLLISLPLAAQQKAKPNIVIINVDDMGWKDLGYAGSTYYITPNIDQLSREGFVFTQGYAAASNCAPSRACLMAGSWTPRHGIYTVGTSARGEASTRKMVPVKNTNIIPAGIMLLPQALHNNGYLTCQSGKWHISGNPLEKGFDVNIGGGHYGHPKKYYPPYGIAELKADEPEGRYLTDIITNKTIEFIKQAKAPFFINYAPYAVHTPITGVDSLKPKYVNKPASQGQGNIAYATMIENLDMNIGLLISALKKAGHYDNTLIVFTTDNGGLFGITRQAPLRSGKGSYYEGGTRVPFFFVWKGRIAAQVDKQTPITNLDIYPTLLDAAGIDKTALPLDGQTLLPMLTGGKPIGERPLYWHFPIYLESYNVHNNEDRDSLFRTRPGSVIRLGDWKLHHYYEDNGLELYNLKDDIGERRNLATVEAGRTKSMLDMLNKWREQVKAPAPTGPNPAYKP